MTPPEPAQQENTPTRVVIQQPALPKYRVPVFAQLARRPGIRLKVVYDNTSSLTNAPPDGFEAEMTRSRSLRLGRRTVQWHGPQWRYATRQHTDVLILSWNLHYTSLIPSLLRAKANGVPTILWGHGYSKHEAAWRRRLRESVTRLSTAVLFYNHTAAQSYISRGWNPSRVFVAINSLDQTPIQNAKQYWAGRPEELAKFRKEQRLDDGPVVLFVSRLEPANRLDLLLRAAAKLRPDYPRLSVVIIGRGDAEQRSLSSLAQSLDILHNVRFQGAIYDETQLAPWFMSADVFCYPANIGLSILHAFGYGQPVVTSNRIATQNPEIEALKDGQNGLLYDDGDADSLARTLRRFFEDRGLAERMSSHALQTVIQGFTLGNMVDGMEAAIRYCTQRSARQAGSG